MEDIKSLYLAAKSTGSQRDVDSYVEAVNGLFDKNPNSYIRNIEYIISSSIGLKTFNEFVSRYGLSIAAYDTIMEAVDKCIGKCEKKKKDHKEYDELKESLEAFREKYNSCFSMYQYYMKENVDDYIDTYYGFNKNGIQNSKLVKGMINKFGEMAIPDILITANKMKGLGQVVEYVNNTIPTTEEEVNEGADPLLADWMMECSKEISDTVSCESLYEKSNQKIVDDCKKRNNDTYREAVIMGNTDVCYEYTENEINAIKNLIEFKEYQLTGLTNHDAIMECENEICSLYESLPEEVYEDTVDEVLPMLPPTRPAEESTWMLNTKDKKSGKPPKYISNNHDMANYIPGGGSELDDDEPSIDSYKRKSYTQDDDDDVDIQTKSDSIEDDEPTEKEKQQAVQNYYYYTYNNSMNKNSHSFNKDNSTHDDHSSRIDNHSRNDDHSRHNDDHSTNKHIRSDNNYKDDDYVLDDEDEEEFKPLESASITEADDSRPKSDNPIRDTMLDVDSKVLKHQQNAKRRAQNVKAAGQAVVKPVKRVTNGVANAITALKDADETNIKERLADPHARNSLFRLVRNAIIGGSLLKAGVLLNPVFLFLAVTRGVTKNKREFRLRNEMITEIQTEIKITEEKIQDAERANDLKAKYQLMRFKNELEKKLLRVQGKKFTKIM